MRIEISAGEGFPLTEQFVRNEIYKDVTRPYKLEIRLSPQSHDMYILYTDGLKPKYELTPISEINNWSVDGTSAVSFFDVLEAERTLTRLGYKGN